MCMPTRPRRSRTSLEAAVDSAKTAEARAAAEFALAVFHDNNSREAEAVPHYRAALAAGLSGARRAEALAWLASSLMKTGAPTEARTKAAEARAAARHSALTDFLDGLERRIDRRSKS